MATLLFITNNFLDFRTTEGIYKVVKETPKTYKISLVYSLKQWLYYDDNHITFYMTHKDFIEGSIPEHAKGYDKWIWDKSYTIKVIKKDDPRIKLIDKNELNKSWRVFRVEKENLDTITNINMVEPVEMCRELEHFNIIKAYGEDVDNGKREGSDFTQTEFNKAIILTQADKEKTEKSYLKTLSVIFSPSRADAILSKIIEGGD